MTDLEFEQMIEDAHTIPILDVAALVMDNFTKKQSRYTAKCPNHTDNKLGNVSFKTDKNYVKCFSCGTTWSTINLVKSCCNLSFKDAIIYLYQNFPSYFTQAVDFTGRSDYNEWTGLSSEEYRFLKFNTKYTINGQYASIRVYATLFPNEHDKILIRRMKDIYNDIHSFNKELSKQGVPLSKLENDRKAFEDKLLDLLKKGLQDKSKIDENSTDLFKVLKSL